MLPMIAQPSGRAFGPVTAGPYACVTLPDPPQVLPPAT